MTTPQGCATSFGVKRSLGANFNFLVWDEIFLNLTDDEWTGERFDERNRFFIGLKKPNQAHSVEFGYLNQFVPRSEDIVEHIAVLYLFF